MLLRYQRGPRRSDMLAVGNLGVTSARRALFTGVEFLLERCRTYCLPQIIIPRPNLRELSLDETKLLWTQHFWLTKAMRWFSRGMSRNSVLRKGCTNLEFRVHYCWRQLRCADSRTIVTFISHFAILQPIEWIYAMLKAIYVFDESCHCWEGVSLYNSIYNLRICSSQL
jgi:hypothetical protein